MTVDVLGFQDNATPCAEDPEDVPSPLNVCFRGVSEASLINEILPEELPAAGGANITL